MKIAIYAIAKNEEKHVLRFLSAASDADLILIADTGSTDNTVSIARDWGATVAHVDITPWRFDRARQAALELLPDDIDVCISVDLDEVMLPGWRKAVEAAWTAGTTRLTYRFDFGQGLIYDCTKAHARHGYEWKWPCHEYIAPMAGVLETMAKTEAVLTVHEPDCTKSRGQYLDLLAVGVAEAPDDARMAFYYGRELYYRQEWPKAIDELMRYLALPDAIYTHERAYAMGAIARAHKACANLYECQAWLRRACAEAPWIRDPWVNLAQAAYDWRDWEECFYAAHKAVKITERQYFYTSDPVAWTDKPHDLLALAAYNLNLRELAAYHGRKALELNPKDTRLAKNLDFYTQETHH